MLKLEVISALTKKCNCYRWKMIGGLRKFYRYSELQIINSSLELVPPGSIFFRYKRKPGLGWHSLYNPSEIMTEGLLEEDQVEKNDQYCVMKGYNDSEIINFSICGREDFRFLPVCVRPKLPKKTGKLIVPTKDKQLIVPTTSQKRK